MNTKKEENTTSAHPLQSLLESVAQAAGFTADQITGDDRTADLSHARQVFCWLAVREGYSTGTVGKLINRDHSTVRHSTVTIDNFISIDDKKTMRIIESFITESPEVPTP